MLEACKLSKYYKSKKAVDEVDLYLDEGESVGLLGPNGAGKSTTISMMSTLIKPTSGDVKFNGKSVVTDPVPLRRVLGVVPQEIALYQELSAYENLQFFGRIHQVDKRVLEKRIQEVLDMVGLRDRQKDPVRTFSGGMKRRVNIAAALLHEPNILILDEPTVGIDPQSRNHILDMVKRLNGEKGTTVLYTSHYMEEVEQLCKRICIMDHGKVIAAGTNGELKSILASESKITVQLDRPSDAFLAEVRALDAVRRAEPGEEGITVRVRQGASIISQLARAAEKAGCELTHYQVEKPSLEDVFLHLTGRTLRD